MVVSIMTGSTIVSTASLTVPTGMTQAWIRKEATAGDCSTSAGAYVLQNAAGASGTKTWTSDLTGSTAECFQITFALRPSNNLNRGQVH